MKKVGFATKLTFQKFNPSQSVCWMCVQRAMFPFSYCTTSSTCIMLDFGREVANLGSNLSLCSLTVYLALLSPQLQIVSLQSHGLIFQINLCGRNEIFESRFAPAKHCTHIFSVMWPKILEFIILGCLFHWFIDFISQADQIPSKIGVWAEHLDLESRRSLCWSRPYTFIYSKTLVKLYTCHESSCSHVL